MNKFRLSPYVNYVFHGSLSQFYDMINTYNIVVYSIDISDNIYFKIHIIDEFKLKKNKKCQRLSFNGLIGVIINQFKSFRRIVGICIFMCIIYFQMNICYEINVISDSNKLEALITEELLSLNNLVWNDRKYRELEESLRMKYFDVLEWINISKVGSYMEIEAKERVKARTEANSYDSLYAYKEGVIASFDVKSGYKLVNLEQHIQIGDELITSYITDSTGITKQTYVVGKVYAYTYNEINKCIKWPYNYDLTKPWAFYNILLLCRDEISHELSYDEKIIDENILQFYYEEGTINMKILYTLYEDITHP